MSPGEVGRVLRGGRGGLADTHEEVGEAPLLQAFWLGLRAATAMRVHLERMALSALMSDVGPAFGIGRGQDVLRHRAWAPRVARVGRMPGLFRRGEAMGSAATFLRMPAAVDVRIGAEDSVNHVSGVSVSAMGARVLRPAFAWRVAGRGRDVEAVTEGSPMLPVWAWTGPRASRGRAMSSPAPRSFAMGLASGGDQSRFGALPVASETRSADRRFVSDGLQRAVLDDRLPMMEPPTAAAGAREAAGSAGSGTIGLADRDVGGSGTARDDAMLGEMRMASAMPTQTQDLLDDYFSRQARLPPAGGGAFDPRLTPVWLGQKLKI